MRGRRWSEAQTLKFVKIYRKHECLWNPNHPGYHQKEFKNKAYSDIAAEFAVATSMSLAIPEVKIKINNLRTTYYQQVNKILQKSTPDSMYEPSLVWFHEMDWCLKRISVNRRSSGDAEELLEDESCPVWLNLDQSNEDHPDPLSAKEEHSYSSLEESSIKRERSRSPFFKKNKKRKFKSDSTAYVEETSRCSSKSGLREDEFDIYGKYIASQLRSMELQNALKAQLEIQGVISRARMSDIDRV